LSAEQIPAYLENVFPELDKDKLLESILPRIEQWRTEGRVVRGATLYEEIAQSWLKRTGEHRIDPRHKIPLAMYMAVSLWRKGRSSLMNVRQIEKWLTKQQAKDPSPEGRYHGIPRKQLEEDLRTATFLVCGNVDEEAGRFFRFAHTSLLEFFLAKYLLSAIRDDAPERWQMEYPGWDTLDFLGQMRLHYWQH
jgi:hypothetical protein